MPSVAEPPAPVAPDLSRPPAFFEDAVVDPAPDGAFFWICLGKLTKSGARNEKRDAHWQHLCIYRHRSDAEKGARVPRSYWTWDGLPAFHITPAQALGLARKHGYAGVVLKEWRDGEWIVLKTWEA